MAEIHVAADARQSPQIGIAQDQRRAIADGLSRLLADEYILYVKTHNFHWNVEGPQFKALHDLFEAQYQDLASAVDDIAERIRALGFYAPGSYRQFAELSSIEEETGNPDAATMLAQLVAGQEAVVRTARDVLPLVNETADEPTLELLTERMRVHEKNAWMLRSMQA